MMAYESAMQEPDLDEVLSDPIVHLVMQRDHVSLDTLLPLLDRLKRQLANAN